MATKDKKPSEPSPEDDIFKELDAIDKKQSGSREEGETVLVKISEDKLKAFVNIVPPMDSDQEITADEIKAALGKAGVKFGIDDEAIEDLFRFGSFNVDVPVAFGKPSADGTPASVEYKFSTETDAKATYQEDEHGNIDLRNLNIVNSVEPGALLAVKTPGTQGEAGMNVLGKELAPKEARDIKLPAGENTEVTEDGLSLIAKTSGQPIMRDNKVCVSATFTVYGDVNYSTGNIDFKGSVNIRGNVLSGFVIKATDDVEIAGNIEKARIEAGGDIRVTGGLYGQEEGRIVAAGSITIRSVESGYLEAGHSIVIGQSARYSMLLAGENITLTNSRGSIVGGKITAGRVIDISNLGSPSFTETIVEVGMNPRLRETYNKLEQETNDHKVQRERVSQNIKALQVIRQKGALPPEKEDLLKKLVNAFHQFNNQIEQKSAKMNLITERMRALTSGRLRVSGKAYPGVRITTVNATFQVRKDVNHSTFYEQNEQIIVGPY